jgi:GMP synthase-like glutamine amidotransferase
MNADDIARFPFLSAERRLLAEAASEAVPVLGICLGAQLLARALGAVVTQSPRRELGFFPVRFTGATRSDPLASCFEDGDLVFQWHRDTFDLPEGAVRLLEGEAVTNQAFRAGEHAWGFQFHLEVTREELDVWLGLAEPAIDREWGRSSEELRREADRYLPVQNERSVELFRRFASVLR